MPEPRELVLLSRARKALAEARTLDAVRDIRNQAEVVKAYARKARLGHQLVVEACEIKVRAERRMGQMLSELRLAKGGAPRKNRKKNLSHDDTGFSSLSALGITRSESSRTQRIATLPEATFEAFVGGSVQSGREPTTAALLRLVKGNEVEQTTSTNGTRHGVVRSLDRLIKRRAKFATIYADPPWPYENQATRGATNGHYPTMSVGEICQEPVERLAARNAHLHLWVPSAFLREAFDVLEAWGFSYRSSFVWVKPQIGLGNYWRVAHELLLLGVRGSLAFQDKSRRSWVEASRGRHSEKPEAVRDLIENVSPGPRLEMYGRRPVSGWMVYGNQFGK